MSSATPFMAALMQPERVRGARGGLRHAPVVHRGTLASLADLECAQLYRPWALGNIAEPLHGRAISAVAGVVSGFPGHETRTAVRRRTEPLRATRTPAAS